MKKKIAFFVIISLSIVIVLVAFIADKNKLLTNITSSSTSNYITLKCDKTKVIMGDVITCGIDANIDKGKLTSFQGQIELSNNLELVSSDFSKEFSKDFSSSANGKYILSTASLLSGKINIGSFKVKVKTINSSSKISMNNIKVGNENYQEDNYESKSTDLKVLSTNANLNSLSVNIGNLSPRFNSEITNYNITTNQSEVDIYATAPTNGNVTGTGKKTLKYGSNIFTITSISESGATKDYKLVINRKDIRNSDNNLKMLQISSVPIKFSSTKTSYEATVNNDISKVNINAKASSSKSIVIGLGKKELKVGKNIFAITVLAENNSKKVYTVIISRKNKNGTIPNKVIKDNSVSDSRTLDSYEEEIKKDSSNNYLKSLKISNYKINFNKDTLEYNLEVNKDIDNLLIDYKTENPDSKVDISDTTLKSSKNIITIKVKAPNGNQRKYILRVNKSSTNSSKKDTLIKEDKINKSNELLLKNKYIIISSIIIILSICTVIIKRKLKK